MEQALPEGMVARMAEDRRKGAHRNNRDHDVLAGETRLPLLALDETGFVIEAEGRTRLRGFVDIMRDGRRLARRLVVCAWAEDGMIGYEFKGGGCSRPVAPDYAPGWEGLALAD